MKSPPITPLRPPPQIPPPASSAEEENLESYMQYFENIIAPGKEPNMIKEYKPRVAQEFERYLNPQTLKQHVLGSSKLRSILEHYANEQKRPLKQLEKQAREIIDEIGLERNLTIIRCCGMAITNIGKRITSGIYVNSKSIDKVKRDLGRYPVLYLPSHRSYMDFILMSYICFYYDIEIPGIAAGMDFHSMFGMGTMLRKTGAFFMRRSFSNDELYWDIFREYMYALVSVYHIGLEFFIEGTRSRNFKALVPKVGLLSMALLPYFTGEVADITIVPIGVSYERVLEEQLFVYELLGVPKPKETTKGFFKALKIIDERFGKMFMDFGEPISVREFFGHTGSERAWRASQPAKLQKLNHKEIELVKSLANEIIYQQQRRIVISTFNLLSLYYASQIYSERSPNIDEIATTVLHLKSLFEALGAHVATNGNAIKAEIIDTVEIHANIVHFKEARLQLTRVASDQLQQEINMKRLKAHALHAHTMAIAVPALALQLYVNPTLFWLARPAYMILAAMHFRSQSASNAGSREARREYVLESLAAGIAKLDEIFKHEFIIESNRETEEFSRNLNIMQRYEIFSFTPEGDLSINENDYCRIMLSSLAPFLCMYYQLTITLNEMSAENPQFTAKDVLIRMQERIERLMQLTQAEKLEMDQRHIISYVHPYCLALDNLNTALYAFTQANFLSKVKSPDSSSVPMLQASSVKCLKQLEKRLLEYCQLLPFKRYFIIQPNDQSPVHISAKL